MSDSETTIPVADPGAPYRAEPRLYDDAVRRVLESGWYILGKEVEAFEREFAAYLSLGHAVGVANGTDALVLAMSAVGVEAGDEVITVSHSAVATAAAVGILGAKPVFVDICRKTRGMDPAKLRAAITPRTKAIVPVHIYGQPCDIVGIVALAKEAKIPVIEDCAQAHGATVNGRRVGGFGDAAAFSFYPTKNLGTFGDGGAVGTNSPEIAEQLRLLRQYGWKERYLSAIRGFNSRLDEVHAAILRVKLAKLDDGNARRTLIAERYCEALKHNPELCPPRIEGTASAYHLFVVELDDRDRFREFMHARGVATALHYPFAIHQQAPYEGSWGLLETERLYRRLVSLPMFPELTDAQVDRVCAALREWAEAK